MQLKHKRQRVKIAASVVRVSDVPHPFIYLKKTSQQWLKN
jgi:hypothetical protein